MGRRVKALSPAELDELRARILEGFEKAAFTCDITAALPAYHADDVAGLVRAFVLAGDLVYIRGRGRGTVYFLTPLGQARLDGLRNKMM